MGGRLRANTLPAAPTPNTLSAPLKSSTMGTAARSSGLLVLLLLLLLLSVLPSSADDFTVSLHPAKLVLPPGRPVEGSPGSKVGSVMACNRVHIRGVPRLRNLNKYSNSLKVRVAFAVEDSGFRTPPLDVCFHRNGSIGVGMCPADAWEKVGKGLWARSMSPYDTKILDLRLPLGASSKLVEVSTEEEFLFHRLVFLVAGVVMMVSAHWLSHSVVFYYSSAMAVGILLVVLIILFQGMKLLPTGRKSSLAVFMYSSVIGVTTFLLRYLSGLLKSVLVEIGISEDMHNPLVMLLIFFLVLVGAWLGFWSVHKLVIVDGSVDDSIATFVEGAVFILAIASILESSLDSLLALEALIFSMALTMITRTRKFKLFRRLYRKVNKFIFNTSQYSPSMYTHSDYGYHSPNPETNLLRPQNWTSALTPGNSNARGSARTPPQKPSGQGMFYSTFHRTPDRKKYSEEEWKEFTRDSTRRAMEELCSSPDFGRWAAANADRLSVTPLTSRDNSDKVRRRFNWF